MNMALFVCPFVRLFATQDLTIDSSFFSDICVLGSRKVRKVKNPEDLSSQEGLKSPKNGTRISFCGFYKDQIHMHSFYMNVKVQAVLQLSAKSLKNTVLVLWSKNL